jgi:hypothetical protein
MSKVSLLSVLQDIEKDIKKSSEAYRTLISNYEIHEFTLDAEDIILQVETEMKAREGVSTLSQGTRDIVRKEVRKMVRTLYKQFHPKEFDKTGKKWTRTSELQGGSLNFTFVLAAKPGRSANVFNTFKRMKQVAQRPLIKALNKKLRELNSGRKEESRAELISSRKGFLDLGHEKDSSVSLQRAAKVQQALWKFDGNKTLSPLASKVIDELAGVITFEIGKDDKGPPLDVIRVKMESKAINRASTSKEKNEVLELNKALKKAAEQIGQEWAYIEGSDSSVQKRRKIIIEDFVGPLRKSRKAKVRTESTKVKRSKGKGTLKSKKPKGTKKQYKDSDKTTLTTTAKKGVAGAPLALLAAINKELPETVRKNMNSPSLQNQTGRFAESVRATDIMATNKGFPSIGYTYQRDPYQVFEDGAGAPPWANGQRDPRSLIDKSIREIAAEFAIGRFYTRRV